MIHVKFNLSKNEYNVLDVQVSSTNPIRSFYDGGFFDLEKDKILHLDEYGENLELINLGRYFASDHALIGGDYTFFQ